MDTKLGKYGKKSHISIRYLTVPKKYYTIWLARNRAECKGVVRC